ncbi:MAG TPA: RagB/SusD family nutrient uptake outer membrane protein [Chryseolinea sp.]
MNRYTVSTFAALLVGSVLTSCFSDLDTEPLNKRITTSASVYKDPASFKQFLAKLYAAMTLTGQRGEYGQPEINAPDEGTTSFLRTYWSAQEITTDECISAWGDPGLTEFHGQNWSEQNGYVQLLYQRVFINIAYCNEFIREVTPRIDGLSAGEQNDVKMFVAEARFLRALHYYFALDLWGNVPFVTEADAPGAFLPKQISRADLFAYIQKELEAIEPALAAPGTNEYARADQAAAWMLLAKLNLNAEVYLGAGNTRYTECLTYCNKIISAGKYSLTGQYKDLFLADNDRLHNEIIFPIAEDGNSGRGYGGVTFIIHAAVGGSMDADGGFGIASGGWSGNRMTNAFVDKFADPSGNSDHRAIFYTNGQTLEIDHPTVFTEGYLCAKFKNLTSTGIKGQNPTFVDTDFPLFRLADVYLMYAEAVKRGGSGGDLNTAVDYINQLRARAYGNSNGNIAAADLTLPFILDERGRELYWEAQRRTDLIRFGVFSGDAYLWDWKGNVKDGASTQTHYSIFPIPASDRAVNTNLVQNPGY